ncbi:MAG: integrase arm-type DNA-binding domain-containing protein [Thermoanaerobaculia bacterium]
MLTDRQVKSLRTDLPQVEVYDGSIPGFGVRVTNKGRKSFFLFYRARRAVDAGRRLRRVTFGSYPYVSLADARERAKTILLEIGAGKDPNAGSARQYVQRRSTHRAGRTLAHPKLRSILPEGYLPGTFGELAAAYMSQYVWLHSKAPRHYETDLKRDLLPQWKDKPLSEIGRREAAALLGVIVERGAPKLAHNLKSRLGAMYNWGIDHGLATTNPVAGMKPLATRGSRTRYLAEKEIGQLWSVLDSRPHPSSDVYKLILLTACRPGEALGLRWDEISEDGTVWTLPEERSKNGMAHRMYLTPAAREILARRRPAAGASPYVFASDSTQGGPLRFLWKHNAAVREEVGFSFNPHDLRRTASTHLARLGVREEIREAVLNHRKRGLRGVYNLYEYDRETREALELWGDAVMSAVAQQGQCQEKAA